MNFSRFFDPIAEATFFSDYFEKQPLHISRDDPAYFADVYSRRDVEDSLIVGSREADLFGLVKLGSDEVAPEDFTFSRPGVRWRATGKPSRDVIDPRKVATYFEQGYTLIVKDAGLFSARLQRSCNALQSTLKSYAQANVYMTPSRAQGFSVHHDTHDTLTAQIEGVKTWRIYEPIVELPQESQPTPRDLKSDSLKLSREVTLRAGDTLYLPRGFPHEAVTSGVASLHVTFALAPVRAVDIVDVVMRMLSDSDVEFRRALPLGWTESPDFADKFAAYFGPLIANGITPDRVRTASEIALNELFVITRGDAANAFEQSERIATMVPSTLLRVAGGVPYMIRERENTIDLLIAGKSIGFPTFCATALRRLAAGPITVGELDPGLTEQNRWTLLRMLVLEGLVEVGPFDAGR